MVTEDYVSFEVTKLLKEKGFDWSTLMSYDKSGEIKDILRPFFPSEDIAMPTLQMAMKWLRDVHNLIVSVKFTIHGCLCDITKIFRDSNGFTVNINNGIGDDSLP